MKLSRPKIRRTTRTDPILHLTLQYNGDIHSSPTSYNKAAATALHALADAIAKTKDAYVDPEIVIWMHEPGKITAEVPLSPKE